MKIGSHYLGDGKCQFTVWAPLREKIAVHITAPQEQLIPLEKDEWGYWQGTAAVEPGALYFYQLDGSTDRPDPVSSCQPQGVHGPSQVVARQFSWNDASWQGIPLSELIIYELHVGTFTPEGTFEAMIPRLSYLQDLGVNAIEIMPVAQFPGDRNWGYDGVYLFGVQHSYGGVEGLKKLVDAAHQAGIAVILDVVYNHLGPEGNYLWDYGPYFTDRYHTLWGSAINLDDAYSNEVRNFFIQNVLYWLDEYHIDGLRLDAVHAIYDQSAKPLLQELAEAVDTFNETASSQRYLIAESDLNDVRVIRPPELGGFGIHSQWSDDFHHALHTLLTGEESGYYLDFGSIEHLEKAFREGYVYSGQYSHYRQRNHGNSSKDRPGEQFVIFAQNHDQIGNRLAGDRLSTLIDFEGLKLAAGAVLLSPYVPLLFMGEEYGEEAPFQYFVSHGDPDLIEGVRKGRAREFEAFGWQQEVPDPQGMEVFMESKLRWQESEQGNHQVLRRWYKRLIQLRKEIPALASLNKQALNVSSLPNEKVLMVHRTAEDSQVFYMMNFAKEPVTVSPQIPQGNWQNILDSADQEWLGSGATLPQQIQAGQSLTMAPVSFGLFRI
ncbi:MULTISPECIES: malto-oligosyltrehalose trehalohydrolase [unclassified Coleofasciculus]|uniref:malto-oligosyltrehalose trehalohydrolase n=1 Tax=unclassified Coleofasciculus TaxID=2692782 RepID=UPI0018807957|nr:MULTISPECIES: malto-oligosyltrehalose trehalohydrolase [unclassified Coleofasciculus]MBE9128906.1 malto-oligosyltrehalose trehalohydrolase [Coleofasciculus sp. LEGE 07081]MBE9151644.1 malto-oligosyltrehalose trehalohydrolase [Coleofasciculus sp. LEGE 07092]